MRKVFSVALAIGLAFTGAALAMPMPLKSVPGGYYSGRWYEIARTTSHSEHDCDGVTYDFTGGADGGFSVALTCHKGKPTGPAEVTRSSGKALDNSGGAKFKLTFLGVVPVEYWVLDRDQTADSWFIMARDNGKYVWIVSRKPVMDVAQRNALVARIKAMGLKTDDLEYPEPLPV
ncbi:MAG: lipocalin [Caulobacteraceae bacterium]|nr:lipocalin [Caulobacteraceae bacterium]